MPATDLDFRTPHCADLPAPIRVLLADDHRITLWGLQQLIDAQGPHMQVVGAVTSRDELLDHPALPDADVVILDLDLGGESGADALQALQQRSDAQVLVLTAEDDPAVHRDVVVRGAHGVVHKSAPAETLLKAIEKVAGGELWLEGRQLVMLLSQLTGHSPDRPQKDPGTLAIGSLTQREREIVIAMTGHPDVKQLVVAATLGISEHTLRNHLTTIYGKLSVRGRLALYVFARQHGLHGNDAKAAQH